jgi:hypothetical protein
MHAVLANNFRVPRHGFPRFLAVLEVLYFQQSVNLNLPQERAVSARRRRARVIA